MSEQNLGNASAQLSTGKVETSTPPSTSSSAPMDWTSGFNDDLKSYVQTKGFKDPASVLESYKGVEKLLGVPKDKLLRLPEKEDAPEWSDIYNRLGRPQTPKDYKFDVPKGTEESFVNWAQENFYKLGLSQKQGEKLMKEFTTLSENTSKVELAKFQEESQKQEALLKREWAQDFDGNVVKAQKAAKSLGLDGETIDKLEGVLGYDGVFKLLHRLESGIAEHQYVANNGQGNGPLTQEAARLELKQLMGDKSFASKVTSGDAEALNKWNMLNKIIANQASV